jgi:hypothetical protein
MKKLCRLPVMEFVGNGSYNWKIQKPCSLNTVLRIPFQVLCHQPARRMKSFGETLEMLTIRLQQVTRPKGWKADDVKLFEVSIEIVLPLHY